MILLPSRFGFHFCDFRSPVLFKSTHTLPSIMLSSRSRSQSSATTIGKEEGNLQQKLDQILKYHQQTKHSFTRYARGPHGLDWANQPNPFRRYISAPLLPLQHLPPQANDSPLYPSIFLSTTEPSPLSAVTLSRFLYDSLALSAWKTTGYSTWSLRVNPSSGNLHPTEAYIISPSVASISDSPFVAHYAPKQHALELRTSISAEFFHRFFPEGSFVVGLSSIFWREAWKYGERGFRYCNHDVGHAIGAVTIAAASLGWDVKLLDGLGYNDLQKLMGLGFEAKHSQISDLDMEHPDCAILIFPYNIPNFSLDYASLSSAIVEFPNFHWNGKPNSLSKEHLSWDIIYRTAEAVTKPLTIEPDLSVHPFQRCSSMSENSYKKQTVRDVVRKRRSAVDMDGVHMMNKETFYQILLHCLPSGSLGPGEKQGKQLSVPFRVLPWDSQIHAVLFVHRIANLQPGLYFLVRNESHLDDLKKAMRPEFEWEKPDECPLDLPLYLLAEGDFQKLAKRLSCHQDIASDSCFSLGMVARFEPNIRENVWMYPRLFWESGILGQVLYLEPHAVGISATGIGCYFDDAVHDLLGLSGSEFQSLYHFTVGGPVLDKRIMSLPAYPGPEMDA